MGETNEYIFFVQIHSVLNFHLLCDHKPSLGEGISGSIHFSEVFAFDQRREAPEMLLSVFLESQMLSARNNSYPKWHILAHISSIY